MTTLMFGALELVLDDGIATTVRHRSLRRDGGLYVFDSDNQKNTGTSQVPGYPNVYVAQNLFYDYSERTRTLKVYREARNESIEAAIHGVAIRWVGLTVDEEADLDAWLRSAPVVGKVEIVSD